MEKKVSKKSIFTSGIIANNPLLVQLIGCCPSLAITTSVDAALGMGMLVIFVLTLSNITISSIRKFVPQEAKIPAYIVVIATFVTIVSMLTEAFAPDLFKTLGVFISLIVVNCVILGRAEAFASKNGVVDSALDGLGMGLGYTIALTLISFFREIISTGSIVIGKILPLGGQYTLFDLGWLGIDKSKYVFSLFGIPAGAFFTLGIILSVVTVIKIKKQKKAEEAAKALKAQKIAEAKAAKAKADAEKAKAAASTEAKPAASTSEVAK